MGLPDPGPDALAFSDEDVEALRTAMAAVDLLGSDAAFQLIRVIGSSLACIADAEVGVFLTNVGGPLFEADPSDSSSPVPRYAATLLRGAGQAIDVALRRHVESRNALVVGRQDTLQIAVGFADLVGSTALAQDLPFVRARELDRGVRSGRDRHDRRHGRPRREVHRRRSDVSPCRIPRSAARSCRGSLRSPGRMSACRRACRTCLR